MNKKFLALAASLGLVASVAVAQTISVPQVSIINNGDLFQDVVNGQPQAGNQYVSALTLAGYTASLPARSNVLIGGDATTNLFQRGTTGSSVTTTATYGGPDRWFYWSGTSTAMTVSRDSTAADLPSAYKYGFKMARTSAQTGVVQVCMAQDVESANSYQFQGNTAEFDFHATAGSNFSAANSQMTAYIITGTGTDEGSSAMAFGLNAGGGGGAGWTGQANATAGVVTINTGANRYAVVASIPTTATEIGVALCFTPVGTAGTNDYIAFSGIQLTRNPALASKASATAGYSCDNQINNQIQCTSFDRSRTVGTEAALQYRYAYVIAEGGAASHPLFQANLVNGTSTTCYGFIPYPAVMRAAPSYTNGLTASTFKLLANASGTMTAAALSTPFSAVTDSTTGNGTAGAQITFTASGLGGTVGDGCILEGIGGSGAITLSAEL